MASHVVKRVYTDAVRILNAIRTEIAHGRPPYVSDVRALVGSGLVLDFDLYLNFFQVHGLVSQNEQLGLLGVTPMGIALINGDHSQGAATMASLRSHFSEALAKIQDIAPDVSAGLLIDGRYQRMDCLGAGSFGRVWTGKNLATGRAVAIKVFEGVELLNPRDDQGLIQHNLLRILQQQAGLAGSFILPIHDLSVTASAPYVVTELAQGGNLRRLMDTQRMTPTLAIRYVVQIGLALRTAHKAGVIHGDLKPENILLDDVGNVLLSDFALTRLTRSAETMLRRAYVGYGSLGYMAPETFRPGQAAEPANDIYALGILMYEMFSGHLPGRRSPMPSEVVEAVPAAVDDIFDRMTRDALDQRVSSIDEVLEALWSSPEIRELLDHRTGPFFIDRPVDLPGLEYVVMEPMPAVTAASPSSPPKPRGENASAEDGSAAEAGDFAGHLGEARWSGNETALGADADGHSARVEVITEGREPSIADGRQGLHEADDADHPLESVRRQRVAPSHGHSSSVDGHAATDGNDERIGETVEANAGTSQSLVEDRPTSNTRRPKPRGRRVPAAVVRTRTVEEASIPPLDGIQNMLAPSPTQSASDAGDIEQANIKRTRRSESRSRSRKPDVKTDSTRLLDRPEGVSAESSGEFQTKEIESPKDAHTPPRPVVIDEQEAEKPTRAHTLPTPSVVVDQSAYAASDEDDMAENAPTEVHHIGDNEKT